MTSYTPREDNLFIQNFFIPCTFPNFYIDIMVYCCAFGCNNGGVTTGISFFKFLKSIPVKKERIRRVYRVGFVPSPRSVLCSQHFESESFTYDPALLQRLCVQFGNRGLRPGAIPTIFPHKSQPVKRHSTAVAKRRRLEVC